MTPRGGADAEKRAVKMHRRIPTSQRSIAPFASPLRSPHHGGFNLGGLHLNDKQCGCSRDIRADLYFSFHGKSRSLGDTHLENSLLGFVHFPVGKRDRAVVSAPWDEKEKANKNIESPGWRGRGEMWMSGVRAALMFSFNSRRFLDVLNENVEDAETPFT